MSAAHCPGCGTRHRAIRYGDNLDAKPLGYRISHKPDCTVLAARRERLDQLDRERASRSVAAAAAVAPNPAHAHEAAVVVASSDGGIGPHNPRFEVPIPGDATASQQSRGTVAAEQLKADAPRPHSIHFASEETA